MNAMGIKFAVALLLLITLSGIYLPVLLIPSLFVQENLNEPTSPKILQVLLFHTSLSEKNMRLSHISF